MTSWFHTAVLATAFAATVAVGLASASLYVGLMETSAKADRLPVIADASRYITIETRGDGVSVLNRVALD